MSPAPNLGWVKVCVPHAWFQVMWLWFLYLNLVSSGKILAVETKCNICLFLMNKWITFSVVLPENAFIPKHFLYFLFLEIENSWKKKSNLNTFNEEGITEMEHFPGEKHFILATECNLEFLYEHCGNRKYFLAVPRCHMPILCNTFHCGYYNNSSDTDLNGFLNC